MVLKSVLFLCLGSFFCACGAMRILDLQGRLIAPKYVPYQPFDVIPEETPESPEIPEKEYGKESRLSGRKFYVSREGVTWSQAREECRKMGRQLATTRTYDEKKKLANYVRDYNMMPKDQFSGYWIGSRRIVGEDTWTWESSGEDVINFGWLPGEPNSFDGEDCMEFKKGSGIDLGWNNYFCDGLRRYICENLPGSQNGDESDKYVMVDSKDTLHEEMAKEYVNKEDDNDESTTEAVQVVPSESPIDTTSESILDHHIPKSEDSWERAYNDMMLRRFKAYPEIYGDQTDSDEQTDDSDEQIEVSDEDEETYDDSPSTEKIIEYTSSPLPELDYWRPRL